MRKQIITFFMLGAIAVSGFSFSIKEKAVRTFAEDEVLPAPSTTYKNHDADTYYAGIDDSLEGEDLLEALQSLNSSKRKSTTGYKAVLYTAGKYTDYDVNHVRYDSNGQPYSEYITGFYSGTVAFKANGMNREHVWPDSHGGHLVESDIHMPRPTIQKENGSRGNSFYVQGTKHTADGWDPAMESFGDETYRGDSARIIFYCVVANSRLSLIDETKHDTSKKNPDYLMGKLSDLLSWNLNYAVNGRENNRNEGAEYLQGNRNPFIDHPEYACRIWGKYNSSTESICSSAPAIKKIEIVENNTKVSESEIETNSSKTYEARVESQLNSNVEWSLLASNGSSEYTGNSDLTVSNGKATITTTDTEETFYLKVTHSYTDDGETRVITAKTKIIVKAPGGYVPPVTFDSIEVDTTQSKINYAYGEEFVKPHVVVKYSDGSIEKADDSKITCTGFNSTQPGNQTVTVKYKNGSDEATTTYVVLVKEKEEPTPPPASSNGCGGNIVTTSVILSSLALAGVILIVITKAVRKKKAQD